MDELKNGIDTMVNASQNDKADMKPKPSIPADKLANMNTATDIEKEVFKRPITQKNASTIAKAPTPTPKPIYKDLSDDDLYEDLADNQYWYGNAKDVNQVADTMSKRLGISPKRALDFAKKNWKGEKTWFSVDPDELDELIDHAHNTYDREFRGDKAAEGFIKDYEFGNMDENFDPSKDYKLGDDEKEYIKKRFNELRPIQQKREKDLDEERSWGPDVELDEIEKNARELTAKKQSTKPYELVTPNTKIDDDDVVIYKEFGDYKMTNGRNWKAPIQNAHEIQSLEQFEDPDQIVDYLKKYSKSAANKNFKVIQDYYNPSAKRLVNFDEYGLPDDESVRLARNFLALKGINDVYKLNNADFNKLAQEIQKQYGIKDFDLAQELLVAADEANKNSTKENP